MAQENRTNYWLQRFEEDSSRLTEEKRLELGRIRLAHIVGLQPTEIEVFINPAISPNTANLDEALRYTAIEGKVARAYSSPRTPIQDSQKMACLTDLRKSLDEIYTTDEIDEIFSYTGDDTLILDSVGIITMYLMGRDHYIIRRTRNAYLPAITSLISIDPTSGKGADITHTLFDGSEDAVSQIERLLLGTNH